MSVLILTYSDYQGTLESTEWIKEDLFVSYQLPNFDLNASLKEEFPKFETVPCFIKMYYPNSVRCLIFRAKDFSFLYCNLDRQEKVAIRDDNGFHRSFFPTSDLNDLFDATEEDGQHFFYFVPEEYRDDLKETLCRLVKWE